MLIGDIAKGTKLVIEYDSPDGKVEYESTAIEAFDTEFSLLIPLIRDSHRVLIRFEDRLSKKVKLAGSSGIEFSADVIKPIYVQGKLCHCIYSRTRASIPNKRKAFRLPFRIDCSAILPGGGKVPATTHDISFEGISFTTSVRQAERIKDRMFIEVRFQHGLSGNKYDIYCRVVRKVQKDDDVVLIGCQTDKSGNPLRQLIMQLQLEEAKRKTQEKCYWRKGETT